MAQRLYGITWMAALVLVVAGPGWVTKATSAGDEDVVAIAAKAYVYAYPMMQTYRVFQRRIVDQGRAVNRFYHRTELLDHRYSAVVAPNNDTLYSTAWLDLRCGPVVLTVPRFAPGDYGSVQLIDLFTHNIAYIGTRATAGAGGDYLVVGPGHTGAQAAGYAGLIRADSQLVLVLARTLAAGPRALQRSRALQQQYGLAPATEASADCPLQHRGWPWSELRDIGTEQARTHRFIPVFSHLLALVKTPAGENPVFAEFARIGITTAPAEGAEPQVASDAVLRGLAQGHRDIEAHTAAIGASFNGWRSIYDGFGSPERMRGRYLDRAAAAMLGLYGHDREENSAFSLLAGESGAPLSGERAYVLQFEPGELPPVDGFWSLTLYRMPDILLSDNPLGRYSLGDRSDSLAFAEDGSLTLYVQHDDPGPEYRGNWLPAPAGEFALALRLYLPHPDVYQRQWVPPPLRQRDP